MVDWFPSKLYPIQFHIHVPNRYSGVAYTLYMGVTVTPCPLSSPQADPTLPTGSMP